MAQKSTRLASRIDLNQTNRKTTATGPKQTATPPESNGAVRTKPVRVTSDLSPVQYRELSVFCHQLAVEIGRARVPQVEVHRALLDELRDDVDLALRVRARVADQLSQ